MLQETGSPIEVRKGPTEDGLYLVTDSNRNEWKAAEAIEAEVFMKADYVTTPEELSEEYKKYQPKSSFALVIRDGQVVGSMRIIHYSPDIGFKTLDDIQEERLRTDEHGKELLAHIDPDQIIEVGTIAVKEELRSKPEDEGKVAFMLYGVMFSQLLKDVPPYVIASFDEDYFNRFKNIFGPGCHALGPATDYMGSLTVPVLLHIPNLHEHMSKTMPQVRDAIIKAGEGMREIE